MMVLLLGIIIGVALVWLITSVRVIQQYEQGVVFRFGRALTRTRSPGLAMIVPVADRLQKVNMQIITMPVPSQDGITRDNVTVRVDAVIFYRVIDPVRVIVDVENYTAAVGQVAQTSLRSIIGKSDLDDLLSNREQLNAGLELMIDSPAVDWGLHVDRVEIKDVALPESMKRSMSRQAEAERERRARVITADGELQASTKLAEAASVMQQHPAALQLRLLQTVVEVASEKNSTLVLPFPVELLRFLERSTPPAKDDDAISEPEKVIADLTHTLSLTKAALDQNQPMPGAAGSLPEPVNPTSEAVDPTSEPAQPIAAPTEERAGPPDEEENATERISSGPVPV